VEGSGPAQPSGPGRALTSLLRFAAVLAVLAAAGTPFVPAPAGAATLEEIRQRGYMRVATEDDCPPFEYRIGAQNRDTHEPIDVEAGYDNDLLAVLRRTAGFEIRQDIVPWQQILPGVAAGKYDAALSAVTIIPRFARLVNFTVPTAEATMAFIKLHDDRRIRTVKDLAGKTLGVQTGGASADVVQALQADLARSGGKLGRVVEYATYAEAYEDLVGKRVDAVINHRDSLALLVRHTAGVFDLGGQIGRRSYAAWAVQKGNRSLLEFLNAFLLEQRTNGTLRKLEVKYDLSFSDLPGRAGVNP